MKKVFIIIAFLLVFTPNVHASESEVDKLRTILGLLVEVHAQLVALVEVEALQSASDEVVAAEGVVAGVSVSSLERTSDNALTIIIENAIVSTTSAASEDEALIECEKTAYNTDYMWKEVECLYGDESIYKDIFVAG